MGKGVTWRDMVRSIATARIVTRTAALGFGIGSQNAEVAVEVVVER